MKKFLFLFVGVLFFTSCGDSGEEPGGGGTDTPLPKASISSVTLFEGNEDQIFTFTVNLNTTSTEVVSLDFNTEEVSAGIDTDFIANSGTISISPGEQKAEIEITVIADEWQEADEQFKVVLSNPVNVTIIASEGLGTIRNDDDMIQIGEDGYATPISYPGLDLIWNDEFDGNEIDTDNWTHEEGNHGWGNQEWQNYTDRSENSFIDNGNLVIEAREESFGGSDYTSARMVTRGKQEFAFGRIDIRAILPEGQGIWPALWMLGANFGDVGWPHCGEIDIMELLGHEPSTTHGTAHWGPQGQSWSYNDKGEYHLTEGKKFSDEYHVFSIIWEPGQIDWYLNDNKFFTIRPADVNGNYPFNAEFFFIFNIAVGGQWPGYPDDTTVFPQRMIVDYIRVFQ